MTPWNKGKTKKDFPQLGNSGVKKGNVPWNKGKHPDYVRGENHPMYGKKHTENSIMKMKKSLKGRTPWNKGKKTPKLSGKNNGRWKDAGVSLVALHEFVKRKKGKAKTCIVCGKKQTKNGRGVQWANLDHTYKRNLEDYVELCVSCHRRWDFGSLAINLFEWRDKVIERGKQV